MCVRLLRSAEAGWPRSFPSHPVEEVRRFWGMLSTESERFFEISNPMKEFVLAKLSASTSTSLFLLEPGTGTGALAGATFFIMYLA